MRHHLLALALAFNGSAAVAQLQTTTTTNCQSDGFGGMRCTTMTPQPPPPPIDYAGNARRAFEAGREARLQMEQQRLIADQSRMLEQQAQQQAQAQQETALDPVTQALEQHKAQSWEAAKLVSAGDCPGAESYALSVGNLVLAKQVKDYCGPAK